ncbi:MAG: hypothetical protein WBG71_01315 [Leeuwenhoekiella sp.]
MRIVLLFLFLVTTFHQTITAQTAAEIIKKFIKLNGGDDHLDALHTIKWYGKINAGKEEMSLTGYKLRDGRQATIINHDGVLFVQSAFDGITLWATDLTKDKPKVITGAQVDRLKARTADFPLILQHYKGQNHDVTYEGVVKRDGKEVHKIKLTTLPYIIGGNAILFDHYYYFDKETYYPIAKESSLGNGSDMTVQTEFKEVDGYYFPFRISQAGETIEITRIEVNPRIDPGVFVMPEIKKER